MQRRRRQGHLRDALRISGRGGGAPRRGRRPGPGQRCDGPSPCTGSDAAHPRRSRAQGPQREEHQRNRPRLPKPLSWEHGCGAPDAAFRSVALKLLIPVLPSERFYDSVVAAGDLIAREGGTITFLFTKLRPPLAVSELADKGFDSGLDPDVEL